MGFLGNRVQSPIDSGTAGPTGPQGNLGPIGPAGPGGALRFVGKSLLNNISEIVIPGLAANQRYVIELIFRFDSTAVDTPYFQFALDDVPENTLGAFIYTSTNDGVAAVVAVSETDRLSVIQRDLSSVSEGRIQLDWFTYNGGAVNAYGNFVASLASGSFGRRAYAGSFSQLSSGADPDKFKVIASAQMSDARLSVWRAVNEVT